MNKTFWIALLSLITVAVVQAGERLNNEQLKAFYTKKTLVTEHFKLGPGKTYFGKDGAVHSKSDSGKERIGKWWIDDDMRCLRWNDKNKDFCHYTEKNDDGTYSLIHGKNGKKIVLIKETLDGNQL